MTGNPNTLVVLGPSTESYFIGHGRRHFVENMPQGFTNHAKTDLNVSMTPWIRYNCPYSQYPAWLNIYSRGSTSKTLDTWITYNAATTKVHFNGDIKQDIRDHLSAAEFVSFPDDDTPGHYFVKGKNNGAWNAHLSPYFIQQLNSVKSQTGFIADIDDDEITEADHPLCKVLMQYNSGWCIERGSTLCFYDSRYFFKRLGGSEIQMHWNLPPDMHAKLLELREIAQRPEEIMDG
ncbi:hypothetical protein K438DRAFT_1964355 [Mycena galopus ATCC 62051]|nr:hypothetical protein K438DRAFT_1964355 [Mycena galopus ATCC 62051]